MRHAREGQLELDIDALPPDHGHRRLDEPVEELLVGKRHLDVELGDLLHPIRAQVLVAEADCDLVVAIEARHHRELLEDLRALGQREEPALLEPARDDEVACALGRRLEEDRRLDVEEAGGFHLAPDDPHHLRPQRDVALELRTAEVEPAVAQAERLVDVLLVELEGQRRAPRDDLEPVDLQLHLARRQLRVDRFGRSTGHLTLGLEHELVPRRRARRASPPAPARG